jgi:hypothetical protein
MSKNNPPSDSESPAPEPVSESEAEGQLVPRSWDEVVEELKIREAALKKMASELARLSPSKKPKNNDHETR